MNLPLKTTPIKVEPVYDHQGISVHKGRDCPLNTTTPTTHLSNTKRELIRGASYYPLQPGSSFLILQLSSHLASCLMVAGEPRVSRSEPSPPSGIPAGWVEALHSPRRA
ncbi:hypothetical protein Pmani_025225 [Petrolisthes manimaculis]|uniref:Uncharacterized protein n=1 Tax=Petrolisthes manimaculis TaxID=1843537 RepID=A0AAE1P8P1_9EUCA|nr:hypothetical protein Pmani_025225 [Petrolisthes manimaculis]